MDLQELTLNFGGEKGISHQLSRNAYWEFVEVHLPKLDAEGSNPFSRSILSITYKKLASRRNPLFEVTGYADPENPLKRIGLKE